MRGSSSLPADIVELHRDHTSEQTRLTVSDLLKIIQAEIVYFSNVFILVDAMDECSESNGTRNTVLTTLENLLSSPSTRIILTSRHITDIETYFPDVVYLEIRASDVDIRKYLETRIPKESRLARRMSKDVTLQEPDVSTTINKAEGMYVLNIQIE